MKNLTTVTVSHKDIATEVGFLPHPSEPNRFVPVLDGLVLVKAPSLRGHALVGSLLPAFTTADERTALKAVRKLNSGAWAPVSLLTKGGAFRKGFEKLAADASGALKVAREARKAELEAAKAERKAEKAAVKAAAPKAPKKAKAKAKAAKAAKTVTVETVGNPGLLRFCQERDAVVAHLTGAYPMAAATVAMAYGIDVAIVESLAAQIAAAA